MSELSSTTTAPSIAASSEVAPTSASSGGGAGAATLPEDPISLLKNITFQRMQVEYAKGHEQLMTSKASLDGVTLELQNVYKEVAECETHPAVIAYLASLEKKKITTETFHSARRCTMELDEKLCIMYKRLFAFEPSPGGAGHDKAFIELQLRSKLIEGHEPPYVFCKEDEQVRPICPVCALKGKLHPLTPIGGSAHWDTVFQPAFRNKKSFYEESFGPEGGDIDSMRESPVLKGLNLGAMNKWEELIQRSLVVDGEEPLKSPVSESLAFTSLLRCNYNSGCSLLLPVIEGQIVLPPSLKRYIDERLRMI